MISKKNLTTKAVAGPGGEFRGLEPHPVFENDLIIRPPVMCL